MQKGLSDGKPGFGGGLDPSQAAGGIHKMLEEPGSNAHGGK